nr:hypothetical protein [Faecalibaculum rodentium]
MTSTLKSESANVKALFLPCWNQGWFSKMNDRKKRMRCQSIKMKTPENGSTRSDTKTLGEKLTQRKNVASEQNGRLRERKRKTKRAVALIN